MSDPKDSNKSESSALTSFNKIANQYSQAVLTYKDMSFMKPANDEKIGEISKSKTAKMHFFTPEYKTKYQSELEKNEDLRKKDYETKDSIDYYNRKYNKKAENDKRKSLVIPGAFLRVRAQGGAVAKDIEEINKFYKRSFVTLFAVLGQAYMTVSFLYESRLVNARYPRVFHNLPYFMYPGLTLATVIYIYRANTKVMANLDVKYTPIWIDISKEDKL